MSLYKNNRYKNTKPKIYKFDRTSRFNIYNNSSYAGENMFNPCQ